MKVIVTDMGYIDFPMMHVRAYLGEKLFDAWWEKMANDYFFLDDINALDEREARLEKEDVDGNIQMLTFLPPRRINLLVAKAVCGPHRWIQVLAPALPYNPGNVLFAEKHSIHLGQKLAEALGQPCQIINDSKDAVKQTGGWISPKAGRPGIFWKSRKSTKSAHNLAFQKATQIFSPRRHILNQWWELN